MSPAGIRLPEAQAWKRAREIILEDDEWNSDFGLSTCGFCYMPESHGHADDCLYVLARDWQEPAEEGDGEE